MPDLVTTVAIATIISAAGAVLSAIAAFVAARRTPKLPQPPITPVSTMILGVTMNHGTDDLPGFYRRK